MNKNLLITSPEIRQIFSRYHAQQKREALRMYKFVHNKIADDKELKRFQKNMTEPIRKKLTIFDVALLPQHVVDDILKKRSSIKKRQRKICKTNQP